jgi:transposase-like protein
MKFTDFKIWFDQLSQLSRGQQEQVKQHLGQDAPQVVAVKALAQFQVTCCPTCQADQPYRWGQQAGLQRFRCRLCRHTFTTLSGTPLARLRHKEQ